MDAGQRIEPSSTDRKSRTEEALGSMNAGETRMTSRFRNLDLNWKRPSSASVAGLVRSVMGRAKSLMVKEKALSNLPEDGTDLLSNVAV